MKCLLFFAALITTATAVDVSCQCSSPLTTPVCTAENTCTIPDGQCYSMQSQIAIGKDAKVNVTSKGCSKTCNENAALFSADDAFYLLSKAKCCNANDCNNVAVELPSVAGSLLTLSSKNLVCTSCYNLGKTTCDGVQMKCKEAQTQCFTITGKVKKGADDTQDFAAKGCATPGSNFKNGVTLTLAADKSYTFDKVEFADAKSGVSQISSCLSFAILLPSVLWFLLDSSLY